jgi:NAD(P)-dependent dehydrogenase (short-subunit alcohol dehydrogenase family)
MHTFKLSGRTAVVIGGTSGLGKAIALGLAEAGADVVASARRKQEVDGTAHEIEALGRRTLRVESDVRNRETLEKMHDAVLAHFGRIDILVNSAGITFHQPAIKLPEERWSEILDINLNGTFRACQIFGATMIKQKRGAIINLASLATFLAFRGVSAYCVSKAAVGALTKSLALEWASDGVRVNAIAPGIFPTSLSEKLVRGTERGKDLLYRTPMGRFGSPSEIAGAVIYLASDEAAFVNGQILVIDGGFLINGVNS